MEEFYEVVKEEHTSTTCLGFPFLLFLFLWSAPPPQGQGPSIPHLSILPSSNPDDCSSAFKTQCGLKQKAVPDSAHSPYAQALARQGVYLCWLHTAHTTIPTPTSDHGDLGMPSLSQKEMNSPRARAKSVCSSMKHRIWQNVPSTNTSFLENICQWPQKMRIHAESVVSHSAL